MRPNTTESGIFSTKRSSPVSTSRLTRMLVPKPKNAFQSPGVHSLGSVPGGFIVVVVVVVVVVVIVVVVVAVSISPSPSLRSMKRGQHPRRGRHPAEDPPLRLD